MARKPRSRGPSRAFKPAETPDDRENQLISLASDLAERQLRDGTASSQVITHFLKMGSSRERKEQARLERENLLLSAKVDQIRSAQRIEAMYADALDAMRTYTGGANDRYAGYDDYDDYDEFGR